MTVESPRYLVLTPALREGFRREIKGKGYGFEFREEVETVTEVVHEEKLRSFGIWGLFFYIRKGLYNMCEKNFKGI